ncbi:MAG: AraC family transcriptional regulator ligand-binding domain-containing protein [Polyangiaceae bacterium]
MAGPTQPRRGSVSVMLLRPLVLALAPVGADALSTFYRASDLTPEMLADSAARVSAAQFCVAWATAERLAPRPRLALELARDMPIGAFGVVEYVCRAEETLARALTQWVRYLRILDDAVEVALVDLGETASLRVVVESEAPAPGSHELCFALVVAHARRLVSPLGVRRVGFAHVRASVDQAPFTEFFGAEVSFGAKHTELVFDRATLEAPLASRDPNLAQILVRAADAELATTTTDPPLSAQVRRALAVALTNDDAELPSLAKRLGLTPRSLQRRLKDEGTTVAQLRDEERRRLADRYLAHGHSISEVAFLLGFSEPSAFFRAFKRWTGETPDARRQALA